MQTIELDIDKFKTQEDVLKFLENEGVAKGDTVKVLTEEDKSSLTTAGALIIILLVISHIFLAKKETKRQKEGGEILDKLLKGKSIEEIEKEVEKEYGVKIEVEKKSDDEREDWIKLSMKGLERAYTKDDPDISEIQVKEPNPKYDPWKKGA